MASQLGERQFVKVVNQNNIMNDDILLHNLFSCLNQSKIKYCVWKNCHEVKQAVRGEDDLDILVSRGDFTKFCSIIEGLDFKEASAKYTSYPYIFHYYGFDHSNESIVHLHVFTRLMTGESHLKDYHLPWESALLSSAVIGECGCKVACSKFQQLIFLVRYYIKISSLPGFLLTLKRLGSLKEEYSYIHAHIVADSNNNHNYPVDYFAESIVNEMISHYEGPRPSFYKILIGLKIRALLKNRCRYNSLEKIWFRYTQIVQRAMNKLLFRYRKRLVGGGCIIAVTGTDGAGKSTITDMVEKWLKKNFDVRRYHFGRPNPVLVTLLYRLMLKIRGKILSKSGNINKRTNTSKGSLLKAFHYLVIAYERFCLGRRIERKRNKGYIIVCDRYKTELLGVMDSPRINAWNNKGRIVKLFGQLEYKLYSQLPKVDLILNLEVSLENAIKRNQQRIRLDKETDEEIAMRHKEHSGITYSAELLEKVDASGTVAQTFGFVKRKIWLIL